MCSHPEHRVEVLPDGQIDETHVLTHDALVSLMDRVREMCWQVEMAKYAHAFPLNHVWEVGPNGK
jgi:hypothetical protein